MSALPKPSSWLVSAALHGAAFVWLVTRVANASEAAAPRPSFEIEMTPPPPSPPAPVETSAPPPELVPPSPVKSPPTVDHAPPATTPPRPTPEAPAAPQAPPADAPLDLTGTTLSDDRGGFAVRAGSGAPMTGPIGPGGGGARPGPAAKVAPAGPPRAGAGERPPELTPKESLSRLPSPPDLTGALLAHYPVKAKELGESGTATLSLVVRPDGRVGAIEVRSASSPEFAHACLETVRPSTWAPPLDKEGRVTATRVGYTCRFDVR